MLWEPTPAEDALRERFGFEDLDAAARWSARALSAGWGVRVSATPRMVISDRNAILWVHTDRGELVLKLSCATDRFPRLDATTRLLVDLARRGAPVVEPVPTVDGRVRTLLDGPIGELSAGLLPVVRGDWLDPADEVADRAAGVALAGLHRALAEVESDPALGSGWPDDLAETVGRWLAEDDPGHAPGASRRLEELLASAPPAPADRQQVHNDVRAANILARGAEIVAVLDFDEVIAAPRIHDVAKAGVYLATRFTDWGPTPAPARRALREGYASRSPLDASERCWLEILTLWYALQAIPGGDDPAGWARAAGELATDEPPSAP